MTIAERNRAIKKVLGQAFGRDRVRVRGSRGTGYGWVHVNIDYAPRDRGQAAELRELSFGLMRAAKIDLGRAYSDDTCQSTTSQVLLSFEPARSDDWSIAA